MKDLDTVTTWERARAGVDAMGEVSAKQRLPLPCNNAAKHKQTGNDNQENLGALSHGVRSMPRNQ